MNPRPQATQTKGDSPESVTQTEGGGREQHGG